MHQNANTPPRRQMRSVETLDHRRLSLAEEDGDVEGELGLGLDIPKRREEVEELAGFHQRQHELRLRLLVGIKTEELRRFGSEPRAQELSGVLSIKDDVDTQLVVRIASNKHGCQIVGRLEAELTKLVDFRGFGLAFDRRK